MAWFILPIINDVYVYFDERYYLTENHLPAQMWQEIIERLSEVKDMILHDTFNLRLRPYIEDGFELYLLSDECRAGISESRDWERCRSEPEQLLFENRYKVAHLYDIFIKWSKLQLHYYGEDCMFNIQGACIQELL